MNKFKVGDRVKYTAYGSKYYGEPGVITDLFSGNTYIVEFDNKIGWDLTFKYTVNYTNIELDYEYYNEQKLKKALGLE